jgi:hypothetical protein
MIKMEKNNKITFDEMNPASTINAELRNLSAE